ncbi:hypothetical protein HNY73_005638 [Argiope bruennichi]|uniref:Uncharacterized protein n=1 Tax=Argiope bruennichi TaxID=94029 RepID=A0A8T0FMK9_ARGBR|nr:hypothetical protein HNY73_005638 [Argiope bruennichi]
MRVLEEIWKEDLEETTAEILCGVPIRLPGEFLSPIVDSPVTFTFVGKLRESSAPPDECTQEKSPTPYEGPFRLLHRTEKTFKIDKHGKGLTVNIERVKPVDVLHVCDNTGHSASESPAQQSASAETPGDVTRPETVKTTDDTIYHVEDLTQSDCRIHVRETTQHPYCQCAEYRAENIGSLEDMCSLAGGFRDRVCNGFYRAKAIVKHRPDIQKRVPRRKETIFLAVLVGVVDPFVLAEPTRPLRRRCGRNQLCKIPERKNVERETDRFRKEEEKYKADGKNAKR